MALLLLWFYLYRPVTVVEAFVELTEQIKLNNNWHQTDFTPQVLKELEQEIAESVPGTSHISQPTVVSHGLENNSASF